MNDDLDLGIIERHHDADPRYRTELRQRVAAILDGTDVSADDAAIEVTVIDFAAQRPKRPEQRRRWVPGIAALVATAAAIAGIIVVTTRDHTVAPTVPQPTTTEPQPSLGLTSGGMWPQSTLDEVRAAQERADAGDPDYTWQVRALVEPEEYAEHIELELVDRFIREVLGWEAYLFNGFASGGATSFDAEGHPDGTLPDHRYVRCALGRTNPLYPPQPGSEQPGELCAPTIDDVHYESVSLDLAQLARQGSDGIWVVNRWNLTEPYAQTDPAIVEAQGRERLEKFLAARVAGNGATGGYVGFAGDIPLLYATSDGAPYERYELDRVDGPWWPFGAMTFSARLFANGGATVVEQEIWVSPDSSPSLDANSTTENGQPIVRSYTSSDGEVTVSAPTTWQMWWPNEGHQLEVGVWFGLMTLGTYETRTSIGFVDPAAYDAWCAANGGSPLLSAPASAAAIVQQLIADSNFEATEPVAARVGGLEAISIDVALAPGGRACGVGMIDISRWIHSLEPGLRLRLYLVDLPAGMVDLPTGMSVQTLAITVVAPEDRFLEVVAETAPIIESIVFNRG